MNEQEVSKEQVFVKGIDAAIVLVQKLKPYCQTIDELLGLLEHAMKNDAQLRLLLNTVAGSTASSRR